MVFQRFCKNHKNASSKTLISYWFFHTFPSNGPPKGPLLGVQKYQKRCTRLKKLTHFFAKKVRHSKSACASVQERKMHVRSSQEGVPGSTFLRRVQRFHYFLLFQKNATPERQKHQLTIRNIAISEKSKNFHEFFMKFSLILQKYQYSLWF